MIMKAEKYSTKHNKSWKMIPNAIKGRVVEDDEQFKIDIGLFSKISDTPACHIYVIPETQLVDFYILFVV